MRRLSFQSRSFCLALFVLGVFWGTSLIGNEFQPKEIWRYKTGSRVNGVACDPESGRVFCGSCDNKLYCLDSSGGLLWSYKTGGAVVGVACDPESGRVFCGSDDNKLYCVNSSGGLLWSYQTGSWAQGVAYDPESGRVFCGSNDNKLYCLDSSGKVVWKHQTSGIDWHFILAIDVKNQILFAPLGEAVAAIQYGPGTITRQEKQEKEINDLKGQVQALEKEKQECESQISNHDQTIKSLEEEISTLKREINDFDKSFQQYELDVEEYTSAKTLLNEQISSLTLELESSRKRLSKKTMDEFQVVVDSCPERFPRSVCSPISRGEFLFSVQEKDVEGTLHHTLYRADPYMKKEASKHFPPIFSVSNPFLVGKDGNIYFCSQSGKIRSFSQRRERTLFGEQVCTSPSIGDNGLLYFSSQEGHLFCIDPGDNSSVWEQRVNSKNIWPSPAIDKGGNAYFADKSTVYAVSVMGELIQKTLDVPIASSLKIGAQGNLYFLSNASTLTSIDLQGEVRWSFRVYDFSELTSPDITLPAFDLDGNVYVGSSNGKIYCIDPKDGSWLWQIAVKDNSPIRFTPTSNDQGEVFFLSEDGSLYRKRNRYFFEKAPFKWLKIWE